MEDILKYLEKFTTIDVPFIEEFLKISEGDGLHDPFNIDIEMMAKWLNMRKGHIKDTLIESYKEKIDYLLLPASRKQDETTHGGHNKEVILLSEDCFKSLCMRSNNKDAEKIRFYYITLEKLVKKYKNTLIEKLKKELKTKD